MSRKKCERRRDIGGSDEQSAQSSASVSVLRVSVPEVAAGAACRCPSQSPSGGCRPWNDSRDRTSSLPPSVFVNDLCRTVDARTCYSLPQRHMQDSEQLNKWCDDDGSTKNAVDNCAVKSDDSCRSRASMRSVRQRHGCRSSSARTSSTAARSASSPSWCLWSSRLFSLPSWVCCLLVLTSLLRITGRCLLFCSCTLFLTQPRYIVFRGICLYTLISQ